MTNNVMAHQGAANKSGKNKVLAGKIAIYAVLVLYALIIILPFMIVILTSFKTMEDASKFEFEIIPEMGFTIDGYKEVFVYRAQPSATLPTLVRGFLNTLIYVLPPTLLGLFSSAISAYAFSKLRFRAKKWMYTALLSTMMIPGMITVAPTYTIYDALGFIDTAFPLMVPGMFGAAACVFFMCQFYTGISDSIIEAAKIDGEGYIGIFFKIIVPLAVPALIAQGLLGFIGGYNDYFGPLIYLQSSDMYNLQVALRNYASTRSDQPNAIMAGTVVALLPTLVVYFIAQEYFIEGIAASGIKM